MEKIRRRTRSSVFQCCVEPRPIPFQYNAPNLKEWLNGIRLGLLYKNFANTGYENLEENLYLMGSEFPINDSVLVERIGIEK
jgi:hypothetical protein